MKITQIIISISIIIIIGCSPTKEQVNHFTSLSDTIVLEMQKIKGFGMFSAGAGQIYFKDTTELNDYQVVFPKNVTNIKISYKYVDWKPIQFGNLKKDNSGYMSKFINENYPEKIDTSNIPSIKDNSICILSGKQGNENVFIIDENNNKDLSDDSVRVYRKMDWKTTTKLIKCKYKVFDGEKMGIDSTWVNIGTSNSNNLLFFVSNQLVSTFSIDDQEFQVGVVDDQFNFCFDDPIFALISENGIMKDSLFKSELLNKGEYLKLGDMYYRFDKISNDGKNITFVKEKDVSNKIGTQIGFIAPDFNCLTLEKDSISLKDYQGKYLLLTNVSSCWSKKSSYECFKEVTEYYKSKINILGIDNSPNFLQQNIKDLKLTGKFTIANENQSIKKNYREDFCSRTCFLISPEGRIVDKFEIFDWKQILAKHFN